MVAVPCCSLPSRLRSYLFLGCFVGYNWVYGEGYNGVVYNGEEGPDCSPLVRAWVHVASSRHVITDRSRLPTGVVYQPKLLTD